MELTDIGPDPCCFGYRTHKHTQPYAQAHTTSARTRKSTRAWEGRTEHETRSRGIGRAHRMQQRVVVPHNQAPRLHPDVAQTVFRRGVYEAHGTAIGQVEHRRVALSEGTMLASVQVPVLRAMASE